MALTIDHVNIIYKLWENGIIGGDKTRTLLEIGEQNWFGDVDPNNLFETPPFNQPKFSEYRDQISILWNEKPDKYLFDIAFLFYKMTFEIQSYSAIDLHGTNRSTRIDLNQELGISQKFSVVTNFGTSEHIFNQLAVFKTIHDLTVEDGLMLHVLPNQGQYNHGFYNYHPTFFYDLSAANNYSIIMFALVFPNKGAYSKIVNLKSFDDYTKLLSDEELPKHSGLVAIFRKDNQQTHFKIPQQGRYGDMQQKLKSDWRATSIGKN